MSIASAVARTCISTLFINAGSHVYREPARSVGLAAPMLARMREFAPVLPEDDVLIVRANAASQVLGGVALITGKLPRLTAFALASSLLPTTIAGHAYWQAKTDGERAQQKIQFEKNLAIIGGLLMIVLRPRAKS